MRKFDANKLYASEVLSILLQSDTENARRLGELQGMDGIDMLLQAVSYYRKRAPGDEDEQECVENLFTSLCTAMLVPANQARFRHSEGFELMIRCMREKHYAGTCALRVLDFATNANPSNGERLLEVGGLKVLFPAFMGKGVVKPKHVKRKRALNEKHATEEHVVAVIANMCLQMQLNLTDENNAGASKQKDGLARILAKFLESDLEKVDRLVELYDEYVKRVMHFDSQPLPEVDSDDEEDEEERADMHMAR